MLTGKFWILEDGKVVDTSTTEHTILAREKILQLNKNDPLQTAGPFYRITQSDAHRLESRVLSRAVKLGLQDAIDHMLEGGDPRWFAIQHYDWIRIAKDGFWVWKFDQNTRMRIVNAKEYWEKQSKLIPHDTICLTEMQSKQYFEIPVRLFNNKTVSFKHIQKYKSQIANSLIP